MISFTDYANNLNQKHINNVNAVCEWCKIPIGFFIRNEYYDMHYVIDDKHVCRDCFMLFKERILHVVEKQHMEFTFVYELFKDYIIIDIEFHGVLKIFKQDTFIDVCNKISRKNLNKFKIEDFLFKECQNVFKYSIVNHVFIYGV